LRRLLGIALHSEEVQRGLEAVRELGLIAKGYEISKTKNGAVVPLIREPTVLEMKRLKERLNVLEIRQVEFECSKAISKDLRNLPEIPSALRSELPRSFDIIGEIAIVEIPQILTDYSAVIGNTIIENNSHVRLVVQKSSDIMGTFRTRKYVRVAGSGNTETVYREFGCRYRLDVAEVYFSPRLSYERMRIARQVRRDEVVVDMFAGVGPYSILIAKSQQTSRIYSIDINPIAIRYLEENAFANRVADRVIALLGDSREVSTKRLRNVADRVIMNLPSEADHYIDAACQLLRKEGGRMHFYKFATRDESIDSIKDLLRSSVEEQNRVIVSFEYCSAIKEVSPTRVQIAVDTFVR